MNDSKRLSVFIKELQELLEQHGDIPVANAGGFDGILTTATHAYVIGHHYDGGCLYPSDLKNREWKRSKGNQQEFGNKFVVITSVSPDLSDGGGTVNGIKLPEVETWEDDADLERQLDNLQECFDKAYKVEK